MDGSYYFVVPKPSFWHLDAGGWEPSTASKADIVKLKFLALIYVFNWQE